VTHLITLHEARLLKKYGTCTLSGAVIINYVAEKGAFPGICSEKSQLRQMLNQYTNIALFLRT
jgi:hypothetical protein